MPHLKKRKEKRVSQRISYPMPAKYKLAKGKACKQAVSCENISGGGARLILPEAVKVGGKITVMLFPKDLANPVEARCEAVWCEKRKDGNYIAGFKFLKIKKEDHFIEFLCQKIIDISLK